MLGMNSRVHLSCSFCVLFHARALPRTRSGQFADFGILRSFWSSRNTETPQMCHESSLITPQNKRTNKHSKHSEQLKCLFECTRALIDILIILIFAFIDLGLPVTGDF